jgi:hypothetical protein
MLEAATGTSSAHEGSGNSDCHAMGPLKQEMARGRSQIPIATRCLSERNVRWLRSLAAKRTHFPREGGCPARRCGFLSDGFRAHSLCFRPRAVSFRDLIDATQISIVFARIQLIIVVCVGPPLVWRGGFSFSRLCRTEALKSRTRASSVQSALPSWVKDGIETNREHGRSQLTS